MFQTNDKNFIARLQGMLVALGVDPPAVAPLGTAHSVVILTPETLVEMIDNAKAAAVRQALAGIPRH